MYPVQQVISDRGRSGSRMACRGSVWFPVWDTRWMYRSVTEAVCLGKGSTSQSSLGIAAHSEPQSTYHILPFSTLA